MHPQWFSSALRMRVLHMELYVYVDVLYMISTPWTSADYQWPDVASTALDRARRVVCGWQWRQSNGRLGTQPIHDVT